MPDKTATHAGEKGSAAVRKPGAEAQASRRQASPVHPVAALLRAMSGPASELSASDILALQRSAGNRAVSALLAQDDPPAPPRGDQQRRLILQAKLTVGAADDECEREADRVSASVVQRSESSVPNLQRQASGKKDDREIVIQRRAVSRQARLEPDLERDIERARGEGQPLPNNLRTRMEQSFGADFSRVRVHDNTESDRLNRSLQSRAFTTGHDLFFKRGEYNPDSRSGQEMIAHELTHVVQQGQVETQGRLGGAKATKQGVIQRIKLPDVTEQEKERLLESLSGDQKVLDEKIEEEKKLFADVESALVEAMATLNLMGKYSGGNAKQKLTDEAKRLKDFKDDQKKIFTIRKTYQLGEGESKVDKPREQAEKIGTDKVPIVAEHANEVYEKLLEIAEEKEENPHKLVEDMGKEFAKKLKGYEKIFQEGDKNRDEKESEKQKADRNALKGTTMEAILPDWDKQAERLKEVRLIYKKAMDDQNKNKYMKHKDTEALPGDADMLNFVKNFRGGGHTAPKDKEDKEVQAGILHWHVEGNAKDNLIAYPNKQIFWALGRVDYHLENAMPKERKLEVRKISKRLNDNDDKFTEYIWHDGQFKEPKDVLKW